MEQSGVALNVHWNYGFNKDVLNGVHNLSDKDRNAVFYLSSHSAIIYDYEYRRQTILQGHCNVISCCTVSNDKRWIVTADAGEDTILVVWDSYTGTPVKTIFTPHPKGCVSVDISFDSMFVVTLGTPTGDGNEQEIAVWAWTKETEEPIMKRHTISHKIQTQIRYKSEGYNFVTTGPSQVCFWHTEEFSLDGYIGKIKKNSVGHFSGDLTSTIFIGDTGSAVTATDGGYVILWENQSSKLLLDPAKETKSLLTASKVVKLVDSGISWIMCINSYIAVASKDGAVRFYDFQLRLESWFEDLAAGPITSLSFSNLEIPPNLRDAQFWVPDFVVGTSDALVVGVEAALFQEIRPDDRRGTLLLQGMIDSIQCITCHPNKSLLVIVCVGGTIQIWDYDLKLLINLRELNGKDAARDGKPRWIPTTVEFDRRGRYLVIGFTDGTVKFVDVDTLEEIQTFTPFATEAISKLVFSPSNKFLAVTSEAGRLVIYKNEELDDEENVDASSQSKCQYVMIGRCVAHNGKICGLTFGYRDDPLLGVSEMLLSVGEDRRCLEYNLIKSNPTTGIVCTEKSSKVEPYAKPTTCIWLPHVGDDVEDKFVVSNDEFKFKEFNADSKQCRKTTMYPSFGGIIERMICIGDQESGHFLVFSTVDKIVGLVALPLTGNPYKMMGLVAHPGSISSLVASSDSQFVFTAGGSDLSVNMWQVDLTPFQNNPTHEEEMAAFNSMLEGGADGDLKNDIVDYFYYCQLRTQGEAAMDVRDTSGKISVEQIPYLCRAIGFYPNEDEIVNMVNEVRYSDFMKTGVHRTHVTFNEFVKLYLNHRPVNPVSNAHIEFAFAEMKKRLNSTQNDVPWKDIYNLLTSEGELLNVEDLQACMNALVGEDWQDLRKGSFLANEFADKVLGFEDSAVDAIVEGS